MAQHDYDIANQSGAAFRSDLNNALDAIVTTNSGATEPATTFAFQFWADTTANQLKMRNAANDGWIVILETDGEVPAKTFTGNITLNAQSDVRFGDSDSSNFISFQAAGTVGSDVTFTLPDADGSANHVLKTNGSGVLSFAEESGGDITSTGPEQTFTNTTEEDTDGGRESKITFKGEQSGGEVSTLAQIEASHDGTSDDEKGKIIFRTNDGSDGSSPTNRMTIDSSGRVGIGTTTPGAGLHLGDTEANAGIQLGTGADFTIKREAGTAGAVFNVGTDLNNYQFDVGNSEKIRIDSSGRLLVGTSSAPSNKNSVTPTFSLSGSGVNGAAQITRHTTVGGGGGLLELSSTRGTSNTDYTILQNGDGIGTVDFLGADGDEFVVAATIQAQVDGTPGADDMPGRLTFSTTADGAAGPTERMRISNSGTVLVGRTTNTSVSSSAALQPSNLAVEVASDTTGSWWNRTDSNAAWVAQRFYAQGSLSGFIQVNTSSVTYSTTSDYRLKENVVPLTGAADRVNQLQVHRFNFIADPDKTVDGFLAHEAQEVVPECVTGTKDEVDDEGNPVYQGIDQSKLVPLLTAALQEAIGRIETLEAKVAALEAG